MHPLGIQFDCDNASYTANWGGGEGRGGEQRAMVDPGFPWGRGATDLGVRAAAAPLSGSTTYE